MKETTSILIYKGKSLHMSIFLSLILCLFTTTSLVRAEASRFQVQKESPLQILAQSSVSNNLQTLIRSSEFPEIIRQLKLSSECQSHVRIWSVELLKFFLQPKQTKTWALHMTDSWGKLPEGIFSGHVNAMGDFDECVGLRAVGNETANEHYNFRGRYCTTYLVPEGITLPGGKTPEVSDVHKSHDFKRAASLPEFGNLLALQSDIMLRPSFASCFPSSCSQAEIQIITNSLFLQNNSTSKLKISPLVFKCASDEEREFTSGDIAMIAILAALLFLNVTASIVDLTKDADSTSKPRFWVELLLSFSIVKNAKALLSTKESERDSLTCFYGLRFLSIAWIILVHTWAVMYVTQTLWNLVEFKEVNYKGPWTQYLVINSVTSVDTFFTLGGCLVSFNLLKSLQRTGGKFNVPFFYLHRYLRLTPLYAVIVGVTATILPLLSSGPNWWIMDMAASFCQKNWWQNLLYINNLFKFEQGDGMCIAHSWYLAVDMQLFLISPLLIYPLWKWKKLGIVFLGLFTLASIVIPAVLTYVDELVPTVITSRPYPGTMLKLYTSPYSRAGPYLVGVWLGYFLFKTNGRKLKMAPTVAAALWCISTASALAIIFGIHSYFDPANEIPRVGATLYAGLHRFSWGIIISWIILACVKGFPGSSWINSFLSWKIFAPLSRLSFCMYLVASHAQWILHLRMKQSFFYSTYILVNLYCSHMVMSILASIILTLTIEMPFVSLDKLLFKR